MELYDVTPAARAIEIFVVEDLSQWWLRRSRKRTEALGLLRHVLLELSKLLAPFVPFTAEDMHTRLHAGSKIGTESVHFHDWPAANAAHIDEKLEEQMQNIRAVITEGLALRKNASIRVRQPLASVTVTSTQSFDKDLEELIRDELNVKEVKYGAKDNVTLDTTLTPALRAEGFAREAMRAIQDMRKEAGYRLDEKVFAQWHSDTADVSAALTEYADMIKRDTLLIELKNQRNDGGQFDSTKEFELAPGQQLWLGVRK
jgi:isoleucyl-tRNA synthetase